VLGGEMAAVGFDGLRLFHDVFSGAGFSISPPRFFQFHLKHNKLITSEVDVVHFCDGTSSTVTTNGLDTFVRSPAHISSIKLGDTGTITAKDSPAVLLEGDQFCRTNVSANMNFATYLMWTPTNVVEQSRIWVPLSRVNWSWAGLAARAGTNWTLISSSNTQNPTGSPTTDHPEWLSNANLP
jgi:hypothetical protein